MKPTATAAGLTVSFLLLVLVGAGAPGPAVAQDIQVNSADPASAPQGTLNLNVTIKGKGFKRGANAQFFVTGTADPGGITVRSTAFVSPSELVASIDVAETAEIAKFDIQVRNSDGRTGKGTELFAVTAKGSSPPDPLVRADFTDGDERVRSDGIGLPSPCPADYDYAGKDDPCNPGHRNTSREQSSGSYFLVTRGVDELSPTRWLVLDFSEPLPGSTCQDLDWALLSYPGRNPSAVSPYNAATCVDHVEVRFTADKAFASGAQFTPLSIQIDGPDNYNDKFTGATVRWNAHYLLEFVNPLTITPDPFDANTRTLATMAGLEQAELWSVNPRTFKKDKRQGTYWMPFSLRLTKLP